ncbi:hypothetical protein DPMN_006159 [Dreissena polymorpha]|uniref:Uncharacterized protein n=1 Tax=Dreissena polymorpha TaxID=45954 RepID=A0A9D4RX52_DREPO|nr:hypothetical protein DPMN_006159 [Dreissena polymorpha]
MHGVLYYLLKENCKKDRGEQTSQPDTHLFRTSALAVRMPPPAYEIKFAFGCSFCVRILRMLYALLLLSLEICL